MNPLPGPGRRSFVVADLNARGELELQADYLYEHLEQIPGAADLIGHFSGCLWRSPAEFESPLPAGRTHLTFRWRASSTTAGLATLRCRGELTSLSLLACGVHAETDALTFQAMQQHLLRELHDTGFEPAFDLLHLQRQANHQPLSATINFQSPEAPDDRVIAALADRCFAASYFRYQGLA